MAPQNAMMHAPSATGVLIQFIFRKTLFLCVECCQTIFTTIVTYKYVSILIKDKLWSIMIEATNYAN